MIEKLKVVLKPEDLNLPVNELEMRCLKNLLLKIDELVDAVNELQTKVNKLEVKVNFAKPEVKENHRIRSTNERLREALSLAENALIRLANDACDMAEHIYIDAILSRIDAITKGGSNE